MQKITPFLWFDQQAEEAVHFYTTIFKNSKINGLSHYSENTPGPAGQVMTVSFQLAGQEFTALNGGPEFQFTPAISFFVYCETLEEIDTLWKNLTEGGGVLMELDRYPFSEKFGWVADRYGVNWQLSLAQVPQRISPCLLFVGDQNGRAEQAIRLYTSLFDNSKIEQVERYGPGQAEPEGAIMHARFTLAGQEFIAMDSGLNHQFTFTPAISFFVHCQDQAEVDHFWEKLSEGGEKGQCGWLEDAFGVSWQIVPDALMTMLSDPDAEKANRVTQAMLKMTRLDIGMLRRAYEQA